MTIAELIGKLQDFNKDLEIFCYNKSGEVTDSIDVKLCYNYLDGITIFGNEYWSEVG